MSGRPLDALSLLNINFLAALKALVEFAKGITNTVKHTFWYYTTSFEKQLKHWRLHIQSVTNRRAVLLRDMQLLNMPDSQGQRDFSRPEPEIAQLFASLTCELDEMRRQRNDILMRMEWDIPLD